MAEERSTKGGGTERGGKTGKSGDVPLRGGGGTSGGGGIGPPSDGVRPEPVQADRTEPDPPFPEPNDGE